MALLPASPALGGGGTGPGIPTADQRGQPRIGHADIGAFQSQGSAVAVNDTADGVGSAPGRITLRQAVNLANVLPAAETITFDPSVFGTTPQTITLTGGQITLTNKLTTTITGPSASLLTVSGNSASGNTSRVFEIQGGSAALSGLTITGGQDDFGGGLENYRGTLSLTNCTISGNSAGGYGGGLYSLGGTLVLTSCTVSGNSASTVGGGLRNNGGTLSLTNCTISGNSALSGGGLFNSGTLSLTNCTVSGNSATTGGGLFNSSAQASMTLTNTIVAGQTSGGDIYGSYTGSNNLVGGAPLLAALGDYGGPTQTYALLAGSPAIGGGTTTGAPATDQRGQSRIGRIDIGAFQTTPLIVNTAGDGTGSPSGNLSLRQAVNLANALGGDAITFDPTVFASPRMIALDGTQLEFKTGATTITGPGASLLTISGNHASRVFQVDSGAAAALSGLTITGGSADRGGGLLNSGGTLALTNCTVSGNSVQYSGGGLLSSGGATILTNCTVSGNSAKYGGGLFNYNGGSTTLADATVSGNSATAYGGGLFNKDGTTTLTNATVSGNSANAGGGLFTYKGGTTTLINCAVSGNSAKYGGGLYNAGSTTTLIDATVSGNSAKYGGGLFDKDGTITLTNATVSGNSANAAGGGLFNKDGTTSLTSVTVSGNSANAGGGLFTYKGGATSLTNTIVAGNTGGDVQGALYAASAHNLVGNGSGLTGISDGNQGNQVGTPQTPINPLLASLGEFGGPTQTMALLPGSPAIGAGTSAGAPSTDQRGLPRSGQVDIGAFQSQGFTLIPVPGSTPQAAVVGTAFAHALAVTVTANNAAEPVDGGIISFAAPAAGPSATLSAATAVITSGQAGVTATANTAAGAYTANATTAGASAAGFSLTNAQTRPSPGPKTTDVLHNVDSLTGLRVAIAYANSHPGPDTITFDPAVFGTRRPTVWLTGGPLVLTDPATTTIIGPGAKLLTISGGRKSRVFDIQGGALALQGVTITGGNAGKGNGGALRNDGGTLWLNHVTIRGNRALVGGGLFNDGKATLTDVFFSGNRARLGSGLFNTSRATLQWRRAPVGRPGPVRIPLASPSQERTPWIASS
jgi:hypothetical protein